MYKILLLSFHFEKIEFPSPHLYHELQIILYIIKIRVIDAFIDRIVMFETLKRNK